MIIPDIHTIQGIKRLTHRNTEFCIFHRDLRCCMINAVYNDICKASITKIILGPQAGSNIFIIYHLSAGLIHNGHSVGPCHRLVRRYGNLHRFAAKLSAVSLNRKFRAGFINTGYLSGNRIHIFPCRIRILESEDSVLPEGIESASIIIQYTDGRILICCAKLHLHIIAGSFCCGILQLYFRKIRRDPVNLCGNTGGVSGPVFCSKAVCTVFCEFPA